MGQTLNGNVDTSATNGFTPGKCDQTNGGWPGNMAGPGGAWATQQAEWKALMAKNGFPNADITNQNSLGAPMPTSTNVIANPGKGVEPANAETPLAHNPDGSITGRMAGTSVVVNLPAKLA
jgi:hypothetical protein